MVGLMAVWSAQALKAEGEVPVITIEDAYGVVIPENAEVDYGDVAKGSSLSKTFTLRNTGTADLTNVTLHKEFDIYPNEVVITQPPATTVVPGGSTTFSIQFTPPIYGPRQKAVWIASNAMVNGPFDLHLKCFGRPTPPKAFHGLTEVADGGTVNFSTQGRSTPVTEQITLTNENTIPLTGLNLTLDGDHAADYSITQGLVTSVLEPGASTQIAVRFSPSMRGSRTAALHLSYLQHPQNPLDLVLTGTGIGPDIKLAAQDLPQPLPGAPYDLHPLRVGTETSASFTISNEGDENLSELSVTLSGPGAASGEIYLAGVPSPIPTLTPGASTTFTVFAKPSALGVRTAQIVIASNDPDENPLIVPVMCTGTNPELQVETVSGQPIPQGSVFEVGSARVQDPTAPSAKKTLVLRNVGVGALRVLGVETQGPTLPSEGTFSDDLSASTRWIPEGGTLQVEVSFTPTGHGNRTGSLLIGSDDEDESSYEFSLQGTGLQPIAQVLNPGGTVVDPSQPHQFDSTLVGTDGPSITYTIRNIGNIPLTLDSSVTGRLSEHFVITTPPVNPVLPGESTPLTVQFKPIYAGDIDAQLKIMDNSVENPDITPHSVLLPLRGTSLPILVSFTEPMVTVDHGTEGVAVTVRRSHSHQSMTVGVKTARAGVPWSRVWFTGAEPLLDYPVLTEQQPLNVNFAVGELEKTVTVPLVVTADRSHLNREFYLTLSPDWTGSFGTHRHELVRILALDDVPPVLTVDNPLAGNVKKVLPLVVSGTATDAKGIDRIVVKLNDEPPVEILVGVDKPFDPWNGRASFEVPVYPQNGPNVVVVTAYDPQGNGTTITREFSYTGRWALNYEATVRIGENSNTSAQGGSVTFSAVPAAGAWVPYPPNGLSASPQRTVGVAAGTVVKLVAKPKPGKVFSRWIKAAGPDGLVMETVGDTLTFTMPAAVVSIDAEFDFYDFTPPVGQTNSWHWLLHPEAPAAASTANEAYLTGILSSGGSFSGKLLIKGLSVPVATQILADSPATFTVAGKKRASMPVPGGELRLVRDFASGELRATITHTAGGTSTSLGRRAVHSVKNKVPATLLNSATRGTYTLRMNPVAPDAEPVNTTTYPQGFGYATMSLSNIGALTLTGVLADGTAITMSTALLSDQEAPLFVQLPTPGGTTKLGLVTGLLDFDTAPASTDVTSELTWFRPAAATPKVLLYNAGWPAGISLDAEGALYSATKTAQAALLGLTSNTPSPARLSFTGGRLPAPVEKTSFGLKANTVVKTLPVDNTYVLAITPSTGHFSGAFTLNLSLPGSAKPVFKGVILQKGTATATGFFLNNAKNEPAQESGAVTLSAPVP